MSDVSELIAQSDLIGESTWAAIAQAASLASGAGLERPDVPTIRAAARAHRAPLESVAAAFCLCRCAVSGDFVDLLGEPSADDVPRIADGEPWLCLLMGLAIAGDRFHLIRRVRLPVGLHSRHRRGAMLALEAALAKAKGVNDYPKVRDYSERLRDERRELAAVEGGLLAW